LWIRESRVKPALAPTVTETNLSQSMFFDADTYIVQGESNIDYAFNARGIHGASIARYELKCGDQIANAAQGTMQSVTSAVFEFKVTDTRGFTSNYTISRILDDYVKPTAILKATMPTTDGRTTLSVSGSCWYGTFGGGTGRDNSFGIDYRMKKESGSWGAWISSYDDVNFDTKNNTYSVDISITGLDYKSAYSFEVMVYDNLYTENSDVITLSTLPVFDWSKTDFNFNVPVSFEGNTMVDMVIEQGSTSMGSNGTWYWRKWKSGKAECWGTRNFGNMGISTAWGALYASAEFSQSLPYGLFIAAPDYLSITPVKGNYAVFVVQGISNTNVISESSTGAFKAIKATSGTVSQVHFSFYAIGRWK
jgi:hypothetical protein